MANSHFKSFFGQNTGLIIISSSKEEPFFFIRCIKKNSIGSWEKSSAGGGKVIKCSIDEIVMILQVLERKHLNWTCFHTYKDNKTQISFRWEDENAKTLWINIANYSKSLDFAQAEILKLLLDHILKEKIKHATSSYPKQNDNESPIQNQDFELKTHRNNGDYNKNYEQNKTVEIYSKTLDKNQDFSSNLPVKNDLLRDISNINGAINGATEKALLISFNSGQEIWIPKSTIHCQYSPKKQISQKFLIDNWILKRNKILT